MNKCFSQIKYIRCETIEEMEQKNYNPKDMYTLKENKLTIQVGLTLTLNGLRLITIQEGKTFTKGFYKHMLK